jgi:hypothetical protein
MMWFVLSLCLLLQTLQYCTANNADCEKLIERLNGDAYKAAKKVGKNWDDCRSVFFGSASSQGISRLFAALETNSWTSRTQIAQDIANATEFASRINVDQLKTLVTCGATISPRFFANVPGIRHFNEHGIEDWALPDDLLEYYDGPMYDTTWMTSEQFGLLGNKLGKRILCRSLGGRVENQLLASISLECLRGLLRKRTLDEISWRDIPIGLVEEWSKYFGEDWEQIVPRNFKSFPAHVWGSILLSMPEKYSPQIAKVIIDALDTIRVDKRAAIDNYTQEFGLNLKTTLHPALADDV